MPNLFESVLADIDQLKLYAEESAKREYLEVITPKIREVIKSRLCEAADGPPPPAGEEQPGDRPAAGEPDPKKPVLGDSVDPPDESTGLNERPDVDAESKKLTESVRQLVGCSERVKSTKGFVELVRGTTERVRAMYESAKRANEPATVTKRLAEAHSTLIKEISMSKRRLTEEDLTLKLTGIPDVQLDDIGVELVSDGEDGGEAEGGEGDDLDLGGDVDLDAGAEDGGEAPPEGDLPPPEGEPAPEAGAEPAPPEEPVDDEQPREGTRRGDDVVLEVSEADLRRGLRALTERAGTPVKGKKHPNQPTSKKPADGVLKDFGGGKSQGDPWLDESDLEDLSENADCDDEDTVQESKLKNEIKFQRDIAETARRNKRGAIAEAADRKAASLTARLAEIRKSRKPVAEGRANRGQGNSLLEESNRKLRADLGRAELNNAKLYYASKLLRDTKLTNETRDARLKQLDRAQTKREVQLVYESFEADKPKAKITEHARPRGSASAPTSSGAPRVINEAANETQRWMTLAGIPSDRKLPKQRD